MCDRLLMGEPVRAIDAVTIGKLMGIANKIEAENIALVAEMKEIEEAGMHSLNKKHGSK